MIILHYNALINERDIMIDLEQLAKELEKMSTRSLIYGVVKAEMEKRGRWKQAPRGKAFKKGQDDRRGEIKKVV